jgi:hypothetical protein
MFKKIIVIFLSLSMQYLHGLTVGSDSAVNRFNIQQVLNTGDRVATFAWLNGGLALSDNLTTATFDSLFPTAGSIDLAAGTLILNKDIIFSDVSSFLTLGNVQGNNHVMRLAPTMSLIPLMSSVNYADCVISLITSLAEPANVNDVAWSDDDQYVAIGLTTGGGNELRVYSFNGTTLTLAASYSIGSTVNAVYWHPSQYWIAIGTSANPQVQTFSFSGNSLTQLATVNYGIQVNTVQYDPTGSYLAVGSQNQNPNLTLYPVNGDGTLNVAGAASINPQFQNIYDLDWNVTGSYLAVGSSYGGGNQLHVYQLLTSPLGLVQSAAILFNDDVNAVSWNDAYPTLLALGLTGTTTLLRIYNHVPSTGSLNFVTGANFTAPICSLDWRRGGECLAVGNKATTNTLRTYGYNNTSSTLTVATQLNFASPVCATSWANFGEYLAIGTNTNVFQVYLDNTFLFSSCVTFSDLNLVMDCNVTFQNCCILFGGNSVINGQGKELTLAPTCTILVDHTGSLLIKNVTINGVSGNQIGAVDSTSTYSFARTKLVMDGNTTFTTGRFDVIDNTTIQGQGFVFAYQTNAVSTVSANAALILDTGVTFSYAPSTASNTLFRLSAGGQLIMNSATLYASTAGLKLTQGELIIDGQSFLSSSATNAAQAIQFGDGVSAVNNLTIHMLPASDLQILSGIVVYANL